MIGSAAKPSRILPSSAPQIFPPSDLSRDSSQNSRKRKRSDTDGENGEQLRRPKDDLKDAPVSDEEDLTWSKKKKCEVRMTGIRPPSFAYPKTAYSDHVPSMPRYSETSVLRDILVSRTGGLGTLSSKAKIVASSKRRNRTIVTQIHMAMLSSKQNFEIL